MYWIHRIGRGTDGLYALHFDALWYLLEKRNCLTIGWYDWLKYPSIVNGVENGDGNFVKSESKRLGYTYPESSGLVNFADMKKNDIVIVLPIPDFVDYNLVVKILSDAKSIIKVPQSMQADFTTYYTDTDGRKIHFDSDRGYYYDISGRMGDEDVDAGFFHEVEILNKIPKKTLSPLIKTLCDNVLSTNDNITNITHQRYIYDNLIPKKFHGVILRP
jgi:hypothetical protein